MSYVIREREGHVGILTINRPEALNALNTETLEALTAEIEALKKEEDLRCVVLRSSGDKAFVAGADIAEMADKSCSEGETFGRAGQETFLALSKLPCPVIAEVKGFALGGGFEIALACDIRIAADNSKFSFPETGLGIMPGFGGTQRLARLAGPALAAELIFTGRRIKADEALRHGLVNLVVPAEELHEKVMEMANAIAANSPIGIREAKAAIWGGLDLTLEEGLKLEAKHFGACFETEDQRAAMGAFLRKEGPVSFKNR